MKAQERSTIEQAAEDLAGIAAELELFAIALSCEGKAGSLPEEKKEAALLSVALRVEAIAEQLNKAGEEAHK